MVFLNRFSLIIFICIFYIAIFIGFYFLDMQIFYKVFPIRDQPFEDLIVLTHAVDAFRVGIDPYTNTNFDPWERLLNYPSIWLHIFNAVNLTANTTVLLGLSMFVIFYVTIFYFLIPRKFNKPYWFFVYALILCSPVALFIVERANIDIFIFLILCLFAKCVVSENKRIRSLSYLFLMIGTVLKLYPVFAFSAALFTIRKRKSLFLFTSIIGILLAVFIYCQFHEIIMISTNTPRVTYISFGKNVLFQDILNRLESTNRFYIQVLPNLVFAIVGLASFLVSRLRKVKRLLITSGSDLHSRLLFICGTSVFVGTFFIGNNFDYRLVFLMFTIPMILQWHDSSPKSKLYFIFIASIYFVTFWFIFLSAFVPNFGSPFIAYFLGYILEQLSNWAILFVLLVMAFDLCSKYVYAFKHSRENSTV